MVNAMVRAAQAELQATAPGEKGRHAPAGG